ncbi:MAG: TM2 domain-containing protein, partial [Spirochaetes bacterium]|nr:TM2 domain-containing protein [Spirochaetota bacterium]
MALIKCKECGKEVSDMADFCPNCGYNPTRAMERGQGLKPKTERKSKAIALLLVFFLWWMGGDRFYLGKIGAGVTILIVGSISLVIGFYPFFAFILAIMAIINFVHIASMNQKMFDITYN